LYSVITKPLDSLSKARVSILGKSLSEIGWMYALLTSSVSNIKEGEGKEQLGFPILYLSAFLWVWIVLFS
jgi:hypothetical protein